MKGFSGYSRYIAPGDRGYLDNLDSGGKPDPS